MIENPSIDDVAALRLHGSARVEAFPWADERVESLFVADDGSFAMITLRSEGRRQRLVSLTADSHGMLRLEHSQTVELSEIGEVAPLNPCRLPWFHLVDKSNLSDTYTRARNASDGIIEGAKSSIHYIYEAAERAAFDALPDVVGLSDERVI